MKKANGRKKAQIVAQFILKALKHEGIDHIFLVPGYLVDPFLPNFRGAGIRPIIAAHEGGAAYMADGYGRARNKFGVCMGIGGPGVTNMTTAIASAYGDRSPLLVIAGKIRREDEGKGNFQDSSSSSGIDDMAIMGAVTEFAATVPEAKSTGIFLRKAIRMIRDVESMPVFLSIPKEIQEEPYRGRKYVKLDDRKFRALDVEKAEEIFKDLLNQVERIAIFAGNGSVRSEAGELLNEFAERFSIPVVTTLRAKGAINENSAMSFGVFGIGGSLQANKLITGSRYDNIEAPEIIIVLGATLNENNTFGGTMPRPSHLILVDINPNSNRDIEYDHKFIMGDVMAFLEWILQNKHAELSRNKEVRERWARKIKEKTPQPYETFRRNKRREIHPGEAILKLRVVADKKENKARNSILVVDSGAHTFFTGHYWKSYAPNEFLLMSTMGPMGYGVAAGIGAKLAQEKGKEKKPVICVVGDGGMLMHGIELHTAVRNKIPLIVVVINNGALGNVYLRFRKMKNADGMKLSSIEPPQDWAKFAESLGAGGIRVKEPKNLAAAYSAAFNYIRKEMKPFLVDVICDRRWKTPNQALELPRVDRRKSMGIRLPEPMHPWFG